MKRFADLYEALDSTTSTLAKVAAMRSYFHEAPPQDAAWALWFLTGRRPKRSSSIGTSVFRCSTRDVPLAKRASCARSGHSNASQNRAHAGSFGAPASM